MNKIVIYCTALLALMLGGLLPLPTAAGDGTGLLGMLTHQLGISEQQASGGIGALMNVVKQNLAAGDYRRLLGGAPDLGTLAGAAPPAAAPAPSGGMGGLLGSAGSLLGHPGLNQMGQLTQSFAGLGLSPDMVAKFAKVALQYVQGSGGADLMKLLARALPL
jgi:hypothetical protein